MLTWLRRPVDSNWLWKMAVLLHLVLIALYLGGISNKMDRPVHVQIERAPASQQSEEGYDA